mmetsp:Transcript_109793/g.319392  ORF Transcript_109793/g.319392 Transcript_109793/m.319392 type:complete len:354 (-) Transcript_109793:1380-2441(-)
MSVITHRIQSYGYPSPAPVPAAAPAFAPASPVISPPPAVRAAPEIIFPLPLRPPPAPPLASPPLLLPLLPSPPLEDPLAFSHSRLFSEATLEPGLAPPPSPSPPTPPALVPAPTTPPPPTLPMAFASPTPPLPLVDMAEELLMEKACVKLKSGWPCRCACCIMMCRGRPQRTSSTSCFRALTTSCGVRVAFTRSQPRGLSRISAAVYPVSLSKAVFTSMTTYGGTARESNRASCGAASELGIALGMKGMEIPNEFSSWPVQVSVSKTTWMFSISGGVGGPVRSSGLVAFAALPVSALPLLVCLWGTPWGAALAWSSVGGGRNPTWSIPRCTHSWLPPQSVAFVVRTSHEHRRS